MQERCRHVALCQLLQCMYDYVCIEVYVNMHNQREYQSGHATLGSCVCSVPMNLHASIPK
jgi:hypothetical protein